MAYKYIAKYIAKYIVKYTGSECMNYSVEHHRAHFHFYLLYGLLIGQETPKHPQYLRANKTCLPNFMNNGCYLFLTTLIYEHFLLR